MRYACIHRRRSVYPVAEMCRLMQVSRSGYYAWCRRGPSQRESENRRIVRRIRQLHRTRKKCYGSPRITPELRAEGFCVGENRVARLMREYGIQARRPRPFKVTTKTGPRPAAPHVLDRDFQAAGENLKWVTDISVPQQAA